MHSIIHTVGDYSVIYNKHTVTYYIKHNGKYLLAPENPHVKKGLLTFWQRAYAVKHADKLANNN